MILLFAQVTLPDDFLADQLTSQVLIFNSFFCLSFMVDLGFE